jgi:membrane associated rhomboid family serine protease
MQPGLKKNLLGTLAFVGLIWLVYLVSLPLMPTRWALNQFGLQPRTVSGLIGIVTMPFLHDDLQHLLANTVPVTVLLFMLTMTRPNPRRVLVCLMVLSGIMLWAFGRSRVHVGCSALVFALAAYLIAAGIYDRNVKSAIAAVLVGVLYGSLFWKLFPTAGANVSWEGHLFGAAAGAVFAHLTLNKSRRAATQQPAMTTHVPVPLTPPAAATGTTLTPASAVPRTMADSTTDR